MMKIYTGSKTEQILNSVTWQKEQNGNNFALGMSGTPEAIHDVFLLLSNSGVTRGDLLDNGSAEFAYIWTSRDKWAYYLAKWELNSLADAGLLPKRDKLTAIRFFYFLNAKWLRFFRNMEKGDFVMYDNNADFAVLGVGVLDAIYVPIQNETPVPVSEDTEQAVSETVELAAQEAVLC